MRFKTAAGEFEIPDTQVAAVRCEAELAAVQVAEFLRDCGVLLARRVHHRQASLPLEFLLEVGAALRTKDWHKGGLLTQLGEEKQPLQEELRNFAQRVRNATTAWRTDFTGAPLARLVFATWLRRFAWFARQELGADVVLRSPMPLSGEEVSAIAAFLWANRHRVAPGTDIKPCEDRANGQ